jgi:hypothetical protein
VKYSISGKLVWSMLHRAVEESFNGPMPSNFVAAHQHGTRRSDVRAGSCVAKSHRGNREDRRRDGTHSTGHNTAPGKLSLRIDTILEMHFAGTSQRKIAKYFDVRPQAIHYHLKKRGLI